MNSKVLTPFIFVLGAPAAFAFPGVGSIAAPPAPPTIAGTVAKGVVSPVTVVRSVVSPTGTVTTVVANGAKGLSSTNIVVKAIQNSTTPVTVSGSNAKAPTATYVPPATSDDEAKNEPNAETDKQTQAEAKSDETARTIMVTEETLPISRTSDACAQVSNIEVITVPAGLKGDQSTAAAVGSMALYPTANGKFVRHKLFKKDAFVVSFEGRWLRHRKTFHLDDNAIVYQGDKLTKLDFLRRGDPVEVSFVQSGDRYLAVAVESNRTGEYVASR